MMTTAPPLLTLTITIQGSINCAHGDKLARNVHAKRFSRARKSIKTPLSSTPMLFKVVSLFLCLKANNIEHNKIWHLQSLSAEKLLLIIFIPSIM